jgi:hypothetical protein
MKVLQKNALTRKALGIRVIEFKFYRAGKSHWRIALESGEAFPISTFNFASEATVLRLAAEKLAADGKQVIYPKGA